MSSVGRWEFDIEANRLALSSTLSQMLRVSRKNAPTTFEEFMEFVHPDDRHRVSRAFTDSLAKPCDVERIDHRMVCTDSQAIIAVRSNWVHLVDNVGRTVGSVGIMRDCPERAEPGQSAKPQGKKCSPSLGDSERMLTLIDNLPGFVYRCRNDRDWTMESLAGQFEELTGYSRDALIDNRDIAFNDLILEEHQERLWEAWQHHLANREPFQGEYAIRKKDGSLRWVWERGRGVFDKNGNLVALEGFITDVTDRKQAEETLRASNERLRLAFRAANMGTWDWDIQNDRLECSPEALKILRTTPEAFDDTYEAYLAFAPPQVRQQVDEQIRGLVHEPTTSEGLQFRHEIVRGDGEGAWVEVRAKLFQNGEGKPYRATGILVDITEQKRAEAATRDLEAQLHQSQKLEAVGQLAGGVAHDFNNILTAILGHVELSLHQIGGEFSGRHDLCQSLHNIGQAAERAATLTRQLLAFSRRDVAQPRPLSINDTLAEINGMLRRLVVENIEFDVHTAPTLPPVWADPSRIEQVVLNLVVNAVQAMPEGGRLSIETGTTSPQNALVEGNRFVMLSVSDTGHGIDAATQHRIFEPFFTTKPPGKGTGLGLSTVHGIVKESGGHIEFESRPGQGTTFRVYLPALMPTRRPALDSEKVPEAPGGTETILLCEDDEAVRRLTTRILRTAGYNVVTALTGEEALLVASEHAKPIDLLITDVIMPELSGRVLSERLAKQRPGLATLYISGYESNVVARHGVVGQGVNFLEKPFSRGRLLDKVREALQSASKLQPE